MAGKSIRIAHGTMAWALAVILAAGVGRAEEATEPGRWVGRVDEAAAVFAWPGSGFVIAFEGRRLVVTLDNSGDNALTVRVGEAVSTVALRPRPRLRSRGRGRGRPLRGARGAAHGGERGAHALRRRRH